MSLKINFYERLGLDRNASRTEIQQAYREAARRLHPDVNIEPGATEHFIHIKEAYEILSNPKQRQVYDHNSDANPLASLPVRIETLFSRESLQHTPEPQIIYALITMGILPGSGKTLVAPPFNISLILDTSTSMKGARLEIVKASAIELLRQLRPQDTASVVAFDDRATAALEASSHINVPGIENRIHALRASGGTEIFQGLDAGYKELERFYKPQHLNHIILITDGHTYGDEAACQKLADTAAEQNITISSLGIGGKWNDELLDDLATRTGGTCIYVQNPTDIRNMLNQKLIRLEKTYAEKISFQFELGAGVNLQYAFQLQPDAGVLAKKSPLRLGSLPTQSQQQILLEFTVDPLPQAVKQALLLSGEFAFTIPSEEKSFQLPFYLTCPIQETVVPAPPPAAIRNALSKLNLYRMQEQAQHEISQGEYNQAQQRLKNVATHLFAQGETELARTVLKEVEHLQTNQSLTEEGVKRIKYGTRALLLPDGKSQDSNK